MLSGLGAGTGTTVAHDTSMMPVTPARFTFLGPAALKEVRQALHGTATAADGISPRPCLDQCCNTVQNALPSPSQAQANHALPCTIGVAGVESGRVHHQRSCGADGRAALPMQNAEQVSNPASFNINEPAARKDGLMMSRSAWQAR